MAATLVASDIFSFADGDAGKALTAPGAPQSGDIDILVVTSVTVISSVTSFGSAIRSHLSDDDVQVYTRTCTGSEGTALTTVDTNGNFNTQVAWQRWRGLTALEASALGVLDAANANDTPTATTGTLGGSGRLVVAVVCGSNTFSANQSAGWASAGYTADQDEKLASGAQGCWSSIGYKTGVGPTAEAPTISWTGDAMRNRHLALLAFTVADDAANGTGSSSSGTPGASGTGTQTYAGTGSSASGAPAASGAGSQVYAGTGSSSSGTPGASGTGTQPLNGIGSSSSGLPSSFGTGTGPIAGITLSPAAARIAALWFTESCTIERRTGTSGRGPVFASAVSADCAIDHGAREVRSPTGETVTSSARVFCSVSTLAVPLGSRVTLPDDHGGGAFIVLAVALHRSGRGTPDHLELSLG